VPQKERPSIVHPRATFTGEPSGVTLYPSFGKVTLLHISTNLVQVAMIRAFRKDHGQSNLDNFSLSPENLRFALELMNYFTGSLGSNPPVRIIPKAHILRESSLVRLYRECGALLLDKDGSTSLKNSDDLARLFKDADPDGLKVAEYDRWRFEALRKFAEKLVELSPSQRRQLVFP
jgi:hypothetical protein